MSISFSISAPRVKCFLMYACVSYQFHPAPPGTASRDAVFFSCHRRLVQSYHVRGRSELVEVVTELPQELMVAVRYSGIADLVAAIQSDFGSDLHDCAGIEVARGMIAGVPLRRKRQALVHRLLQGKLAACALRGRYNVLRKVVPPETGPRSTVEDLGELSVKVIAGVVVCFADGEKYVVSPKNDQPEVPPSHSLHFTVGAKITSPEEGSLRPMKFRPASMRWPRPATTRGSKV